MKLKLNSEKYLLCDFSLIINFHFNQILIFFIILIFVSISCSGHYIKNRSRDFADIATLEMQTKSYGVGVYVGPMAVGINYKSQDGVSVGLRGGQVGSYNSAGFTAFAFGSDYLSQSKIDFNAKWKSAIDTQSDSKKEINKSTDAKKALDSFEKKNDFDKVKEQMEPVDQKDSLFDLRKKSFQARVPFGTINPANRSKSLFKDKKVKWAPAYYFTRFEFQFGAYYGIRFGFNLGELLDFLTGVFGADFYDDDAPYGDTLEEQLLKSPGFKKLPPEMQKRLLEQIKKNPSATLPF